MVKSELRDQRNSHEDALLAMFAMERPETLKRATVLADRGFGDQKLYAYLERLGLDFIIRFRGVVHVQAANGACKPASQWLPKTTRPRQLRNARVTANKTAVAAVVCVKCMGSIEPWARATSRAFLTGAQVA